MTWLYGIALFLVGASLGYNGFMVWTNKWLQKLIVPWLVLVANLFVFVVLLLAVVSV